MTTRREKILAIKQRWARLLALSAEVGDIMNFLRPAFEEMEALLSQEDSRAARETIRFLIKNAAGRPWCAFTYREDSQAELMDQLGRATGLGRVETIAKAEQRYPVFLFFGQAGRDLLTRYLGGQATEDEVMDATQAAL